jgi:uncharacterized protein YbbC (DUF1343 family)
MEPVAALEASWQKELADFERTRQKYLIYS